MLYFILPAYNEEPNIRKQLEAIKKLADKKNYKYKAVIVNDGSFDNTKEEIEKLSREMPVIVINHDTNKGVAEAFKSGFKAILNELKDDDIVITMDADNTQNLGTVPLMVNKINDGYEIVSGSTFAPGGMMIGVPFLRFVLSHGCNMLYRLMFHVRGIHEYTGFYRAHNGLALKTAFNKFGDNLIETDGFAVMAEMLVKYRRIPFFITEVPMIIRYDFKGGVSKLKIIPTIIQHLKIISKNALKRKAV